jgi:hypothetical protein
MTLNNFHPLLLFTVSSSLPFLGLTSGKDYRHVFTKILCNFPPPPPRSMSDKSGHQDVTALNNIGLLNTQFTVIAKTKAFRLLLTTSSKANSSCKASGCPAAKEFPACYKAPKFITIFIRVCHCVIPLTSRIHSTLYKKSVLILSCHL